MNPADAETLMLLTAHMLALGVACLIFIGMILLHRRAKKLESPGGSLVSPAILFQPASTQGPATWLAIRSATPETVQRALNLGRSAPCSWSEGMTGDYELFISPRVNGWVIVTGLALPNPSDDVDACFLFLIALSRKLGHVQFFHVEKYSRHHAWARLDDGCVTRAYAWADKTVWNQGVKTIPEIELGLKCIPYGEESVSPLRVEANLEKVRLLAARWSLDPAAVNENLLGHAEGVAGELSQLY